MSNYSQTMIKFNKCTKNIFLGRVPVILDSCNLEMTNLRTDEMAFFRSLTKIGTDENKAIYSTCTRGQGHFIHVRHILSIKLHGSNYPVLQCTAIKLAGNMITSV